MKVRISKYVACQVVGWGGFIFINTFFAITYDRFDLDFTTRLLIFVGLGVTFSHLMRFVILQSNILIRPLQQQLFGFIFITLVFAFAIGALATRLTKVFNVINHQEVDMPVSKVIISNAFYSFVYLLIWNCIYFIFHYIEKSRKQQVDTLKLEAMVKELELKTIKAHINPHFIFNALNSIRALIDENPGRARSAITELSNILRSSMQTDKSETVPLLKELNIVKDYLALEYIRFEDRLRVEYDIDENTLEQPVPPMMLQTLVENAIKHGISKQVKGGMVKITSDFRNNYHEMLVQNTGTLVNIVSNDGFGLTSTQNRPYLMFGDKARFQINEVNGDMVEAKIMIPLSVSHSNT